VGRGDRIPSLTDEAAYLAAAREVASAFRGASNAVRDPVVAATYSDLEAQTDRLFARLTDPRGRRPIRVVFTRSERPYATDEEMIDAVRAYRLLELRTTASERGHEHPVLSCEEGGAYGRLGAVHDLLGHVLPAAGFDRRGEFVAWRSQESAYRGLARWALATELIGKQSVLWTTGSFAEHKALLIDPMLLDQVRRAGADGYGRVDQA
jgi:hypothetical protein